MRPLFYIQYFWKEGNLIEPESDIPFTGCVLANIHQPHLYHRTQKSDVKFLF